MKKRVLLIAYNDIELLDLTGSQSAFNEANQFISQQYELNVIGFDKKVITSEAGTQIIPNLSIDEVKSCDTLVIPGGRGARLEKLSPEQVKKLQTLISHSKRVITICTGVFILAQTNIPNDLFVTTHWAFLNDLKTAFPQLKVDENSLYVNDDKFWSSAGVTSGIDLTLKLIEIDHGIDVASKVAKQLVVYLKRSGSQQQFSNLLELQSPTNNKVLTLTNWLQENLDKQVTVKDMAETINLSDRQLYRLFMEETGTSPANYLEKLRMMTAKSLLETSDKKAKQIAYSVGFRSYDGFMKAFERAYSVKPAKYRQSFKH